MSIHYNAFISYRHHPDDIRVASEIHRSLERFYVPKSIRKKHGKINRLFRDKEELPITSDLNDDIAAALRNSDYLIVICSVHTKESIWCLREIELFLQSHPRNRVLTVLASGEPYDVIPEILLYDDVVDPVTGETQRIPIEPLSCDWRGKRRKAKQEELPRLAAPLLGCAYDELRQRQKQYKARRNAAIISSALVASFSLTAYFLYTSITIQKANVRIQAQNEEIKEANIQIQANLDEALINQSRHLATAAQERLTEGDRLTAISLAAAALPSENNVRPYVPEADQVLSDALGVYSTSNQVEAVGTVSPGANVVVNAFCVSESEKVIYLYDQRKVITAWDTATLQKLGEIALSDTMDAMITLNNDNLIVHNGLGIYTVACFQPDGTLLWQMDDCPAVTYLPEENVLLALHEQSGDTCELLSIDCDTGKAGTAMDLTVEDPAMSAKILVTTPNADVVLIRYYEGIGVAGPYYAVDLHTGEKRLVELTDYPVASMITQEGLFVFMGEEDGLGMSAVVEGNRVTMPGTRRIYAYDLHTGSLVWENAITAPVGAMTSHIVPIPGSSNLLCVCGNIFMIVDTQTGETVASCGAGSVIESVSAGESFATAILQDGYLCSYHYDTNACYEVKCMKNGVSAAAVGEGCYSLHWEEDHVTVYQSISGKPAWESPMGGGFNVKKQKVWGQYLAFQDSTKQYLVDMESKALLWTMEKGEKELLGFSSDGKKVWYVEGQQEITEADVSTGKCVTVSLELKEGDSIRMYGDLTFFDDCLYYVIRQDNIPQLVCWDLNTGEKESCVLQVETQEDISSWYWDICQVEGRYAWLLGNSKMLLEVDLQTGKTQQIIQEASRRPAVAVHPDGKCVAVSNDEKIYLKKPGQNSVSTIELNNAIAGSLYFHEDMLLALCDNGFIYRFNLSGKYLGQTELWVSSQFSYELFSYYADLSKQTWQFTEDNKLIVNAVGQGNVIDCESWTVTATISNFLLYDARSNCLVCKVGSAISGYTLYDTAALLKVAKEELGDFQLTQEQKLAYGIE